MNPVECVKLCRFIDARCPAMKMQDETPDAWYVDLAQYDFADALEAARKATLDQPFIGIGDLVRECEAIVRRRLGEQRRAELDAELAEAERGEISKRERPLLALMSGTPIKSAPRPDWTERHGGKKPITAKPPFTPEELAAARAELEATKPEAS